MKTNKIPLILAPLAVLWAISAIAAPFDLGGGLSRMGSALQDGGVQNPSIGVQFHVPVDDPSNWNAKVVVPKSANNPCEKSSDPNSSSSTYAFTNKANPCFIPQDSSNK